jgi:hypothetical protein
MRSLFLLGSILWTGVWWFIAWSNTPLFSEYSFFPLWIGYILTLNAVSEWLLHSSLIRKMGASFLWGREVHAHFFNNKKRSYPNQRKGLIREDPFNYALGFPSVLGYIQSGKWSVPISIMFATLFTGFWWEMWNFLSYPTWYYTIPYVGFWKIFEMPLLGYGGTCFLG